MVCTSELYDFVVTGPGSFLGRGMGDSCSPEGVCDLGIMGNHGVNSVVVLRTPGVWRPCTLVNTVGYGVYYVVEWGVPDGRRLCDLFNVESRGVDCTVE